MIELVAVLVILGILAALLLPKMLDLSSNASSASINSVGASITSASHANFAARQAGSPSAIAINQTAVFPPASKAVLHPPGYSVMSMGGGDCSAGATPGPNSAVSCMLLSSTGMTLIFPVQCAR